MDAGLEALRRIDIHEAKCDAHGEAQRAFQITVHERLNALSNRMWGAAVALGVMALSAAGSLALLLLAFMKSNGKL